MSGEPPADGLTVLLCDRIRREARALGAGEREDAELSPAVAGVLHRPSLSDEELGAYGRLVEAGALDPLGGLLSLRIEAALAVGRAHAVHGATERDLAPRESVLVLRRSAARRSEDLDGQVSTALSRIRERLGRHGGDSSLFLLAHAAAFDGLRRRLPPSHETRIVFYTREETARGAVSDAGEVEVHEVGEQLAPLEQRLRGLLDEPERAPDGLGAGDDPLIGALLHRKYRILRRIGTGGFGSVYEARDERGAGNRVAIKLLRPELARNEALVRAFRDEARRVTRLGHPNVVDWKVFDEAEDGTRYFVMELVEGEELDRVLEREGTLAPRRVARLLLQVLDALRAAAQLSETESILHLDLKPRNVFVLPARAGREEQVKVIDFGIGQYIGEEPEDEPLLTVPGTLATRHTIASLSGLHPTTLRFAPIEASEPTAARSFRRCTGCTPEYASPEQCGHVLDLADIAPLDGRSDLYSLGVIAFEMLTGELPYARPLDRADFLRIHRERPPRRVGSMGVKVPRALARFVDRCLAKDRELRFRDAQEAWRHLERIVHPPLLTRVALVVGPLLVAAVAVGAWLRGAAPLPTAVLRVDGRALGAQRPLYLGPARREALLQLPDGVRAAGREPLSVVRVADGAPLAELVLDADPAGLKLGARVERDECYEELVRVEAPELGLRLQEFPLVWLGASSWSLADVALGGRSLEELGGRAVDPLGLALELWLAGSARDEIEAVEVALVGAPPIALAAVLDQDGRRAFELPLERLGPGSGPTPLTLAIRDRAGGTQQRRIELLLAPGAIAAPLVRLVDRSAAAPGVPCIRLGTSHLLTPRTQPALELELERAAELRWWIEGEGLAEHPSGTAPARERHVVALDALAGLARGASYRALLRWELDDRASVLRADGSRRGIVGDALPLVFEAAAAEVQARITTPDGLGRELREGALEPLAADEAVLGVLRAARVPMRVVVSTLRDGEPAGPVLQSDELKNLSAVETSLALAFVGDGMFEVVVDAYPFDSLADVPSDRPESTRRYRVVVDRAAPEIIELEGLQAGALLRGLDDVPAELVLAARTGGPQASAVEATWELVADGDGPPLASGHGALPQGDVVRAALDLSALRDGLAAIGDGERRLVLRCRDRAGNEAAPLTLPVTVALRGPELSAETPLAGTTWQPGASRRWAVQVRALDPNGVEQVRCRVEAADGAREPLALALEQRGTSTWVGELELSHVWSQGQVELALSARDRAGRESALRLLDIRLPEIVRPRPPGVVDARGSRMRLVEGNAASAYVFGGQGDAIENRIAREAGLPAFNNDQARARSWQVRFAPGEIESFYLDRDEVSVGEFRAFLEADDGWSRVSLWPAGAQRPASAERRAELARQLDGVAADLPVSGVDWDEASAFASWAGKRLPSWVEWELAVRGGSYRPIAAGDSGARLNAAGAASAPWPRGSGQDVTPDTGLRDLCGNVAEWTATSGDGPDDARASEAARLRLGDPGSSSSFWVAGASFRSKHSDFSEAERRPRSWSGAHVGFRCALSLEDAWQALEAGRLRAGDGP